MMSKKEKIGQTIPGSQYVRVPCAGKETKRRCSNFIRVPQSEEGNPHWCEECSPKHQQCTSPLERLHTTYEDVPDIDANMDSRKRE